MKNGFTVRATSTTTIELGTGRMTSEPLRQVEVTYEKGTFKFYVNEEDYEPYDLSRDPHSYLVDLIGSHTAIGIYNSEVREFIEWVTADDYYDGDTYFPPNSEAFDHDCLAVLLPRESARIHRELSQLHRMRTYYVHAKPEEE